MIKNDMDYPSPDKAKISVIIPTYNVGVYIDDCLESIVNQTFKNLEVIVVDDGSTDISSAIYGKFAREDARIQVVRGRNNGQSVARNIGMEFATGDYVHFMDSDDYLDYDYYEKMLGRALETGADMTHGGFYREFTDEICGPERKLVFVGLRSKLGLARYSKGIIARFLYRRKFLAEHDDMKFEHGRYFEDTLFLYQGLYYAGRIAATPEVLYYYRVRESSIMNTQSDPKTKRKKASDRAHIIAAVGKFYAEKGASGILAACPWAAVGMGSDYP
jgi:glycosyltransferase involved in cell wall biosynthesis